MKRNFDSPTVKEKDSQYSVRRKVAAGVMAGAALLGAGCSVSEKTPTANSETTTSSIEKDSLTLANEKHESDLKEQYNNQIEQLNTYTKQVGDEMLSLFAQGTPRPEAVPYLADRTTTNNKRADIIKQDGGLTTIDIQASFDVVGNGTSFQILGIAAGGADKDMRSVKVKFTTDHSQMQDFVKLQNNASVDDLRSLLHSKDTRLDGLMYGGMQDDLMLPFILSQDSFVYSRDSMEKSVLEVSDKLTDEYHYLSLDEAASEMSGILREMK
jgi:hypothetical protein